MAGSTGSYERDVDTLERELGIIEDTFSGLSDEDWGVRTHAVRGAEGKTAESMLRTLHETSGRQQHPDPRLPLIG
ncbi:MAG TPA: hypothetical protein VFU54_15485 [Actinomycetota bacterium]|nr:hypothetical protein [Actinomycetota bacterium]